MMLAVSRLATGRYFWLVYSEIARRFDLFFCLRCPLSEKISQLLTITCPISRPTLSLLILTSRYFQAIIAFT